MANGWKIGGNQSHFSAGNYDSKKLKFAQRIDYYDLRDFVVYIKGSVAGAPAVCARAFRTLRSSYDSQFFPHPLIC